jgi:hypothetical protein
MADNITIKDGAAVDRAVATDEISTIHYPRTKIGVGDDGTSVDVSKLAPIPVTPGQVKVSDFTEVAINVASSGDNSIVGATASQTTRLFGFFLMNTGAVAVSVKWRDGTTDLHPALTLNPGGSWVMNRDGQPWFTTTANTALNLNLSGATQVSGRAYYTKSA